MMEGRGGRWAAIACALAGCGFLDGCGPAPRAAPAADRSAADAIRWRLVHHETFDLPFATPRWIEDTYGDGSPYHVDEFDEDGAFFTERGGTTFAANLARFRSFRSSTRYGEDGWLTV